MKLLVNRKLTIIKLALALALASVLALDKAGAWQENNASRADLQAYGKLKARQRALFDQWAAERNRSQGTSLHPAALYAALTPSQRTTYEAVTHALSQSRLTGDNGQPPRQNALELVAALTEVAGETRGASGDKQFRLYVTLAPGAQELLAHSLEFFRDKDNTVFHHEYPNNLRQRGRAPTLQFSISKDGARADIDVDYRSSRIPKAIVNGHLRAANSDVRAGHNYFGHISRWFGLPRWWRFGFGAGESSIVQPLTAQPALASASSAPRLAAQFTPQQAEDARQVAAEAYQFLNAWLIQRDADRADDYLTRRPAASA